jgi:hypothetical protein
MYSALFTNSASSSELLTALGTDYSSRYGRLLLLPVCKFAMRTNVIDYYRSVHVKHYSPSFSSFS